MRVHHLAFRTRDLTRLERFYTDALGLSIARRDGERSVWLRAAGTILMLEQADEGEPEVTSGTKELVAFGIEAPDVARWRRVLEANGIPIEAETAYTLYFRDPDGRRIGLSHF
ncbi:MAG: VOC family protein [Polyangiaceae bacterium]|jgi:glyoxylase I family protein